jgi:hypothetical protein
MDSKKHLAIRSVKAKDLVIHLARRLVIDWGKETVTLKAKDLATKKVKLTDLAIRSAIR